MSSIFLGVRTPINNLEYRQPPIIRDIRFFFRERRDNRGLSVAI